jgi:uncharacterized membrane protein YoaK (UPF0700 family)
MAAAEEAEEGAAERSAGSGADLNGDSGADLNADSYGGVPRPVVVRLLLVLAAAAGSLDVLCVTRLGGPFSSVITGNLVQLGRGISAPDLPLAVNSVIAVAGYAVGVAAATVGLRGRRPGWYARTSVLAMSEVALIAGVVVGWLTTGGQPGGLATGVMLALAGGAMGVQSALTLSTGLRGVSTTYLTGTLTAVVQGAIASSGHRSDRPGLVRLVALLLGAVAGGFVLRLAPPWTPVVPLALVAGAVVVATTSYPRRR